MRASYIMLSIKKKKTNRANVNSAFVVRQHGYDPNNITALTSASACPFHRFIVVPTCGCSQTDVRCWRRLAPQALLFLDRCFQTAGACFSAQVVLLSDRREREIRTHKQKPEIGPDWTSSLVVYKLHRSRGVSAHLCNDASHCKLIKDYG